MSGYALRLRGIVLRVHVGVPDNERRFAQDVSLDIDLELPPDRYPTTDEVQRTADYAQVVNIADGCALEQPYRLLETFVLRVARQLEMCFPQVNTLRVAGTKVMVPVLPLTRAAIIEVTLGSISP
jgi:dihydroneopterin aldolase